MAAPTLEDALRLLTDPDNEARGPRVRGMAEMRGSDTIGGLEAMGADVATAKKLILEALDQIGGRFEIEHRQRAGLGRARTWAQYDVVEHIWVPVDALRHPRAE